MTCSPSQMIEDPTARKAPSLPRPDLIGPRAFSARRSGSKTMQMALVLFSAALCAQAIDAAAQPAAARVDIRRIVEPGGLLDATGSLVAVCQPLRGDAVAVRSLRPQPQGMHISAEVVVLSGRCKDKLGWIGSHRLAAAN